MSSHTIYVEVSAIADQLMQLYIDKELPGEMPLIRGLRQENLGSADARFVQTVLSLRALDLMPSGSVTWAEAERIQRLSPTEQAQAYLAYSLQVNGDQQK